MKQVSVSKHVTKIIGANAMELSMSRQDGLDIEDKDLTQFTDDVRELLDRYEDELKYVYQIRIGANSFGKHDEVHISATLR